MLGDGSIRKIIYDDSNSDNNWKFNSDNNDVASYEKVKSDSNDDFIDKDNIDGSNKHKKRKNCPTISFKCKKFKLRIDGSIKFKESHVFSNVNELKDVSRKYKVKHDYH